MKYLTIFCDGDIKLSGKMVLRKVSSHLRSVSSQKMFLCKCKLTARDFGKRFGGIIYTQLPLFFDIKFLQKHFGHD